MTPYRHSTMRRSAATLIEFLVVLGIIGLLAGLLLPAVQAAREAARRARCASNLGQLIHAAHSFETVNGGFPPSWTMGLPFALGDNMAGIYSVQVRLLPFLEQNVLYNSINFPLHTGTIPEELRFYHQTVAAQTIEVLLCPTDPNHGPRPFAPNSYRACTGFGARRKLATGVYTYSPTEGEGAFAWLDRDGLFLRTLPLSWITDGLSNTLAFSEKPIGSGPGGVYSPFRDWSSEWFEDALSPDDWIRVCSQLATPSPRLSAGGSWMLPGAIYTNFYASAPPNTLIPDCGFETYNGTGLYSARSYHPGGVNAALADGSVRWFSSGTSVNVWRALGTRAGGEVSSE
jgi:prepilin-type processing-associated H-X9-DG protein